MSTDKSSKKKAETPPIKTATDFARYLAKQCEEFGIRGTAARAKINHATLARKVNDPRLMNAREMDRMAPLFGVTLAK